MSNSQFWWNSVFKVVVVVKLVSYITSWCNFEGNFKPLKVRRVLSFLIVYKVGSIQISITVTIWIPNTWNLYIWLFGHFFVLFSNGLIMWLGGLFENQTFLIMKQTFFVRFQTTIWKPNIWKPDRFGPLVRDSDGYCT